MEYISAPAHTTNTGTGAGIAALVTTADDRDPTGTPEPEMEVQVTMVHLPAGGPGGEEEEVCGVCLEVPLHGCFVELWCCGNVLCVADAQQIGKCPFCREEPLVWNIIK